MQDPRIPPSGEIPNAKPRKKKTVAPGASLIKLPGNGVREVKQVQGPLPSRAGQKTSKRNFKNEGSPSFQQPEWSNSHELPGSSAPVDEYRALRHKYLVLEEDNLALGGALKVAENEIKTLEEEKLALLDQLVVLEGLLDPSEVQPNGFQPTLCTPSLLISIGALVYCGYEMRLRLAILKLYNQN